MTALTEADEKMLAEADNSKLIRIARGLEILARVSRPHDVSANHDIIYAGGQSECQQRLDERERTLLDRLGWGYDNDFENYYTHV